MANPENSIPENSWEKKGFNIKKLLSNSPGALLMGELIESGQPLSWSNFVSRANQAHEEDIKEGREFRNGDSMYLFGHTRWWHVSTDECDPHLEGWWEWGGGFLYKDGIGLKRTEYRVLVENDRVQAWSVRRRGVLIRTTSRGGPILVEPEISGPEESNFWPEINDICGEDKVFIAILSEKAEDPDYREPSVRKQKRRIKHTKRRA